MKTLIERLIASGNAYVAESMSCSACRQKDYGKLSNARSTR